jgi:prophage regulatory protein
MTDRIIRLPALKERVPVATSTIYDWIAKGEFPRPISLGARAVGWRESDIDEWLTERVGKGGADA